MTVKKLNWAIPHVAGGGGVRKSHALRSFLRRPNATVRRVCRFQRTEPASTLEPSGSSNLQKRLCFFSARPRFFFSLFQVTWTSYWLLQYYTFILFHITSSYFIFTSLQLDSKFHRWRHYLVWVVHCIPIIYLSHIYCVFNYEPDTMYYLFQVFEYYQATTTIILNLQGGKDSKLRKVT